MTCDGGVIISRKPYKPSAEEIEQREFDEEMMRKLDLYFRENDRVYSQLKEDLEKHVCQSYLKVPLQDPLYSYNKDEIKVAKATLELKQLYSYCRLAQVKLAEIRKELDDYQSCYDIVLFYSNLGVIEKRIARLRFKTFFAATLLKSRLELEGGKKRIPDDYHLELRKGFLIVASNCQRDHNPEKRESFCDEQFIDF